jgi:hypothetical protein
MRPIGYGASREFRPCVLEGQVEFCDYGSYFSASLCQRLARLNRNSMSEFFLLRRQASLRLSQMSKAFIHGRPGPGARRVLGGLEHWFHRCRANFRQFD